MTVVVRVAQVEGLRDNCMRYDGLTIVKTVRYGTVMLRDRLGRCIDKGNPIRSIEGFMDLNKAKRRFEGYNLLQCPCHKNLLPPTELLWYNLAGPYFDILQPIQSSFSALT